MRAFFLTPCMEDDACAPPSPVVSWAYTHLLPALRLLSRTTFSADGAAVRALGGPPLSAAPLTSVGLFSIPHHGVDDAVVSVLRHHGRSLDDLTLTSPPCTRSPRG